jgi:hypothetical protein
MEVPFGCLKTRKWQYLEELVINCRIFLWGIVFSLSSNIIVLINYIVARYSV